MSRPDLIELYNRHFDEMLELEGLLPHSLNVIDLIRRIKKLNVVCQELDRRINPPVNHSLDVSLQLKEVY